MIYSGVYYIQLALIWFSGANLRELKAIEGNNITGQSHQVRAILGAIILLTFFVTVGTTTWMAKTFGVGRYMATGVGLLAGGLKLSWDRRVAVAASQGIAWARMLLALPVSGLLAIPVALALFGQFASDAAKQRNTEALNEKFETQTDTREQLRARKDSLRAAKIFFNRVAKAEENGLTQRQAGLTDAELQRYNIAGLSGVPGCGEGSRCATYLKRAQAHQDALATTEQRLQSLPTRAQLRESIDAKTAEIEDRTVSAVEQLSSIYDESRERPIVGVLFLILVGAYSTVDLLPVLERILSASAYDQVQEERIERDERRWRERETVREWGQRVVAKLKISYLKRVLTQADSASREELLALLTEVNRVLQDFEESYEFADVVSSDESDSSDQEARGKPEPTVSSNGRQEGSVTRGQGQTADETEPVSPQEREGDEVTEVRFGGFSENGHLLLPPQRHLLLPSPNDSLRR